MVVCCPLMAEGFYLTALEAMAKGCLVIVPHCIGNRSYAENGVNCLLPNYEIEAVIESIQSVLRMSQIEINTMRAAAVATAAKYTLENERESFYQILANVDSLWQEI